MKTRWRKVESGLATSTGCAAYSTATTLTRRFRRLPRGAVLGREVPVATTPRARLLGLALLRRERAGAGLLISRCRSVHTFGMRFRLDVFFLDEDGAVISERRGVPPRRVLRCREAVEVLELPAESA